MSTYVTSDAWHRLCCELDLRKAVFETLANIGSEMNFQLPPEELLKLVMKRSKGTLDPAVAKTYIEGLYK